LTLCTKDRFLFWYPSKPSKLLYIQINDCTTNSKQGILKRKNSKKGTKKEKLTTKKFANRKIGKKKKNKRRFRQKRQKQIGLKLKAFDETDFDSANFQLAAF
jgi:hypothetical protein